MPGNDEAAQPSRLHPTVFARAAAITGQIGRPDLLGLEIGETVDMVVDTQRDWYRTGLVIENGGVYRIEYIGGLARDGECPPCKPDGQDAGRWDVRRFLGYGRRLPDQKWLLLGATIAHPRDWKPLEKPFSQALAYLFHSAPRELLDQIAPIGRHLPVVGARLCLANLAPSGLLYLFANDWWQTAANNGGGPRLRITRVTGPDADAPLWSLAPDGARWAVRETMA